MTKDLSDEDLLYLAQRDQLPADVVEELGEEAIHDMMVPPEAEEPVYTGTVAPAMMSKEDYEDELASQAAREAEEDAARTQMLPKPINIVGDYEENWTNEMRRDELEKRDLPTDGNKAELIARLQESDRADGAVDEDDIMDEDEDELGEEEADD
jgi:hypothetical protein